jgi:hypothetical protein
MIGILRRQHGMTPTLGLIWQMTATTQCFAGIHNHGFGDLNLTALIIDQMTNPKRTSTAAMGLMGAVAG